MSVFPFPLQFARSGVSVLGFDLDQQKVDSINAGRTYLKHFSSESIAEQVNADRVLKQPQIPPVYLKWKPFLYVFPLPWMIIANLILSFVLDTARTIAPHLPKGCACNS